MLLATLVLSAAPMMVCAEANDEARYREIAGEVRCLVCQNQTVLDSSAALAGDLRREIRRLIAERRSDAEIRQFLVQRYGDFVLYKPPMNRATGLLWFGPLLLFVGGVGVFVRVVRRSAAAPELTRTSTEPGETERA